MSSDEGTLTDSKLKSKPHLTSFFASKNFNEQMMSDTEYCLDQILKFNDTTILDEIIFKLNVDDFADNRYVTLKVKNYCQHGK